MQLYKFKRLQPSGRVLIYMGDMLLYALSINTNILAAGEHVIITNEVNPSNNAVKIKYDSIDYANSVPVIASSSDAKQALQNILNAGFFNKVDSGQII